MTTEGGLKKYDDSWVCVECGKDNGSLYVKLADAYRCVSCAKPICQSCYALPPSRGTYRWEKNADGFLAWEYTPGPSTSRYTLYRQCLPCTPSMFAM